MYENNLKCLDNIIQFCIKNNSKLIHLSSTSVYGKQADIVDETCEDKYLKPQSPYADNVDLDNEAGFDTASVGDDILDFTERNPFGEVDF